jgi:hypothetical protein
VTIKESHWGYRVLVFEDLDGNELFFNILIRQARIQRG